MIHSTAVVHKGAELDSSVEVGPYCIIGPHAKIGRGTRLASHVVVEGHTQIGEENTIFPFCVIGAIPQDLKYKGEPTKVVIGNRNSIRESVTINLGTVQGGGVTQVGDQNLIMAYVHLGHDCIVTNQCILANNVGLAGHVRIEEGANLGGMVGVSQFVRIGAYCYVTGQSGVERDVPPYCIASGSRPLVIRGANIVGLRRKGFSAEAIQKINESIKLWVRPEVQKDQCLYEIEAQYGDHPEIQDFIGFIRDSRNGATK